MFLSRDLFHFPLALWHFGTLALWHFGRMIETFQGSGLTAYNVNHERNVLTELNDLLPLR